MTVKRHKRKSGVYLAEYKNVREGKKVKSIFVRYLGREGEVEGKPRMPKRVIDRIDLSHSSRAGDVTLLWRIACDLDYINIIDRFCCGESDIPGPSPGKVLTIWAINRVLDPESCTQLERWVKTTDLPRLSGIDQGGFKKDVFLSSLDFVCSNDPGSKRVVDYTSVIDDALYQRWRKISPLAGGSHETVAYDITSVLFFGVTCPLSEKGFNSDGLKRHQVNLALLVSSWDKYPLMHLIYPGGRNGVSTMKNLIVRLHDASVAPGTLIIDRGNVSEDIIKEIEHSKWKVICGVPKTSNDVKDIIQNTDIPMGPETYAHRSRTGHLYAVKKSEKLYGKERNVVVYINPNKKRVKIDNRNEELFLIGEELDDLSLKGKNWSEKKLHTEINKIVGSMNKYVFTRVKRQEDGPRIEWKYFTSELKKADKNAATWALLASDESLKAREVVKKYFEKDYIEKVFRTIKTLEEIEPVRHRLEHRVRAYIFVCVLAYRLSAVLQWKLRNTITSSRENTWEKAEELLSHLNRVERVEFKFGKEIKTTYLNLSKKDKDTLKKIKMLKLFNDEIRVSM